LAANRQTQTALPRSKAGIPPVAIIIGIVVILGGAGFWYLDTAAKRPSPPPPPLTGDAKAYVRNLKLSNVNMNAHESYMKQQIVEITGSIENTGNRVLDIVEINCVFHDADGQLVLRQRVPIVTKKMGGLAPGEVKNFRLPFDSIPESWNQAMPDMVIARIEFA
jgi:hypothetical protein